MNKLTWEHRLRTIKTYRHLYRSVDLFECEIAQILFKLNIIDRDSSLSTGQYRLVKLRIYEYAQTAKL